MSTLPMLSPSGDAGDIPEDKAPDAVKANFTVGQDMLSPDGQAGVIPLDHVHEAIAKGFQLKGAPVKAPTVEPTEDPSLPFGHNPMGGTKTTDITPTQAAGGAGVIGAVAGGAAIGAGAKALLPAATSGVVAVGKWAEAHPIAARLILEGIKGAAWYKLLKKGVDVATAGKD